MNKQQRFYVWGAEQPDHSERVLSLCLRARENRPPSLTDSELVLTVIDAERTLLTNQLSLAQAVNVQVAASIHLMAAHGKQRHSHSNSFPASEWAKRLVLRKAEDSAV